MATGFPITLADFRLRLPKEGPLLGWTRWSDDGKHVLATVFATPDDTESDPALCLLVSFLDASKARQFLGVVRSAHPSDTENRAPYFSETLEIPTTAFGSGPVNLEVLTLHKTAIPGKVFMAPTKADLEASLKLIFDFEGMRKVLETGIQENIALLQDPKPASRSFEKRSDRRLDEATCILRLPPARDAVDSFKLIATTCRYPGFAFESQRVDEASFEKIVASHSDASAMLLLGDQIYADATASLFDKLTTLEKFKERYFTLFRSPGFAKAVRSIPAYMTGDDHEYSNSWSKPDDALHHQLFKAARQSYGIYQISHSPFSGLLDKPPYDYAFTVGPAGVYVMDTLSNRDTAVPGKETIVSDAQLDQFDKWLKDPATPEFVILASAGVVAPGFSRALDAGGTTDVHRAQGLENWQAFNGQRIKLLDILAASSKKILLLSGDYHCAAAACIKDSSGIEIAKAAVVPPAYAPMRYVNASCASLARLEKAGDFEISLVDGTPIDGSGFAVITIDNGEWKTRFEVLRIADL